MHLTSLSSPLASWLSCQIASLIGGTTPFPIQLTLTAHDYLSKTPLARAGIHVISLQGLLTRTFMGEPIWHKVVWIIHLTLVLAAFKLLEGVATQTLLSLTTAVPRRSRKNWINKRYSIERLRLKPRRDKESSCLLWTYLKNRRKSLWDRLPRELMAI